MKTARVAWVAADIEAAGHQRHGPRELALTPDRWGVLVNSERGGKGRRLPDLVFWPTPGEELSVAVVVEHRLPKPRPERAALEGWKGFIEAGQYAQVRYVAEPSSARRLDDEAARVGLANTQLIISARRDRRAFGSGCGRCGSRRGAHPPLSRCRRPLPALRNLYPRAPPRPSRPEETATTPEQAAERQKRIRELLSDAEPPSRRR